MKASQAPEDILFTLKCTRHPFARYVTGIDENGDAGMHTVDLRNTLVDDTLLAILNDDTLFPYLQVNFTDHRSSEAPLLRDYVIPSCLRHIYKANDKLKAVRFRLSVGSAITFDTPPTHRIDDETRCIDDKLYQCITMKRVTVDFFVDDEHSAYSISSDAKLFLTSGLIRLS